MASTSRSRRALLVGVAQRRRKPDLDGPWEPKDPAAMMADVIRSAADDAGGGQLIQEADLLACVDPIAWGYDDLIQSVATLAGATSSSISYVPATNTASRSFWMSSTTTSPPTRGVPNSPLST